MDGSKKCTTFAPSIQNCTIMKTKLLVHFNAILALLLGSLALTGCRCKYGVPYAEFNAEGLVTDQETGEPIENIQIVCKAGEIRMAEEVYTNSNGRYLVESATPFELDSIDIIARDTADIYETDSVRVGVVFEKPKGSNRDEWYQGGAFVYQNFNLKKK